MILKFLRPLRAFVAALVAPGFVIAALVVFASACVVTGVNMLVGAAWALICVAVICYVLAWLLLRGVSNG